MTDSRDSETADVGSGLRVVQRVVFPGDDLDVVPLYVETNPDRGAAELAAELTAQELTGFKPSSVEAGVGAVGDAQSIIRFGADVSAYPFEDAGPRRRAVLPDQHGGGPGTAAGLPGDGRP